MTISGSMTPTFLMVHLTRVQVHRLFPKQAERYPWFLKDHQGTVHDLRGKLEIWPVRLPSGWTPPTHEAVVVDEPFRSTSHT